MKIQIQKIQGREHIVPAGTFYDDDWFKCQNCGNIIRMKVLGNYATCSECGGRMVRICPPCLSVLFERTEEEDIYEMRVFHLTEEGYRELCEAPGPEAPAREEACHE